ncbi:hypothetical protein DPEC_G00349020 [Dallia pectoralis]|uniref:Uncharacterized protein n=1 Tax=Dallia pectoralis TaxID=75939 RepID=A0ACC2F1D9_DALPE|nr:hypothetical protein DPEC_G00349020 [Dallia pectoralis]
MTKKGKGSRVEKSSCAELLAEKDSDAETSEQAGAIATSAAAGSAEVPATNDDILTEIHKMKSAVHDRFDELNGSLSSLKSGLTAVNERVSTIEDAVESHEKRLDELKRRHESLASQCMMQQAKQDYLEKKNNRESRER